MAQPEQFDILILGSGTGGKLLAWHAGQAGRRVAVVERQWIGGSCPNIACLPSKNIIWSAKVAQLARNGAQYGVVTGPIAINMAAVRQRKRDMVARGVEQHLQNFQKSDDELIMGTGTFVAPRTLEVRLNDGGRRLLTGDKVFINVGTHAHIPDVPGLQAANPLSHIEALELDRVPSHLLVLGGGYVGLELAQAYRRFGSRVTIIQQAPQIIMREDPDVAHEMQQILAAEGIDFVLAANVQSVAGRSGEAVSITLQVADQPRTLEGSDILVAAGRVANTAGIGLEKLGVALDDHGFIRVNDRLETTAADVWAIGDCAGSPQFTHVSENDFAIIHANLAGGNRSTRDRLVPSCMFTDPPLAHVGLTEAEAKQRGMAVRVAKLPTSAVLRTHATGESLGFLKILVAATDDRILGFTMIGAEAGEVMAAVQTAMLAGAPYTLLRDAILTHPTMAEGLGMLLAGVPPRSG